MSVVSEYREAKGWMIDFSLRRRTRSYTFVSYRKQPRNGSIPNTSVTLVHRSTLVAPGSVCTLPISRRRLLLAHCSICLDHCTSSTIAKQEYSRHAVPFDWSYAANYMTAGVLEILGFEVIKPVSKRSSYKLLATCMGATNDLMQNSPAPHPTEPRSGPHHLANPFQRRQVISTDTYN
jgi:hypothetical protein